MPQPGRGKRRKGEDDKEGVPAAWRYPFRRAALRNGGHAWRIARAGFKGAKPIIAARAAPSFDPFGEPATGCLSNTLDWMNPDNPPDIFTTDIDADFSAEQDRYFPQL
jgi:hypothetical protein